MTLIEGSGIAISVRNLYKRFSPKGNWVYQGLDLDIPADKVVYLLGRSGVGKSVLLKHFVGLIRPDEGEVRIFGRLLPYDDSRALNEIRKHFGLLFQGSALFDNMTVYENVSFPLRAHRREMTEEAICEKVYRIIETVGLDSESILERLPIEISGGMQRRVALARAVILEPTILLYDEPTTGLDPLNRATVEEMIISTAKRWKLTSVVISHDLPSALRLADYIGFLEDGKIIFWGTPGEFKGSTHPVVRAFFRAEQIHVQEMIP